MPEEMSTAFEKKFALDWSDVVENVYRNPRANVYLASFAKFASAFDHTSYVQEMISAGMDQFVKAHVLPFKEAKDVEVGFVGSVAFAFQPMLREALEKYDCRCGTVIKHPVDRLVEYHTSNRNSVHIV